MTDIDDFVRGLELPYAPHKQGDIPLFPPEQMRAFAAEAIRAWEAQKWRPIAEAPKDGTELLVCTNTESLYSPRAGCWATYHPNATGKATWRTARIGGDKLNPTHFQPLPEPPKETT